MSKLPQGYNNQLNTGVDSLRAIIARGPELEACPLPETLDTAAELGRVALLVLCPPVNLGEVTLFNPAEMLNDTFTAPAVDLDLYDGRIMVSRNTSMAKKTVNFNLQLVNPKAGSTLKILSMTVPRHPRDTDYFKKLPPSSRPNQELFMTSARGTVYPMRGPDDRRAFNEGMRHSAPFFETVLSRMIQANAS